MEEYYVYCLLDPRVRGSFIYEEISFGYEPFYIGKGKDKRINEHTRKAQLMRDENRLKANKILSIQKNELEPIKLIMYKNLEESNALNIEVELIERIGRKDLRKGPLTNLTNGGEIHYKFKDLSEEKQQEIREFHSKRMKENNPMKNPITAKKCGDLKRGILHSDDYKNKMSISLKNSQIHKKGTQSIENREIHRKIQEKNMKCILQYDINMNFINEYPSITEASRQTKIKKGYISCVVNGRQKTTKEFIFILKENKK
jgi:hypothetical protein